MKKLKLGVHAQPDMVVDDPDYAKRLVNEAGVDHFILRSGYGLSIPASMEKAVQIVRDVNADVYFLMGTWWGGSTKVLDLPYKSYESSFPMDMPGSEIDDGIIGKLEKLCGTFKPDGICITHGRFRHPAYIDGIWDEGSGDQGHLARMEAAGISRSDILAARGKWEKALEKSDQASLLKASEQGIIKFLCELSGGDAPERLVSFRCDIVHASMRRFRKTVKAFDGVAFGSNAYSPIASRFCGQTYDAMYAETCEFVQPLLVFMEYHHYELISAWARYVRRFANVDEPSAVEIAKRLFDMGGVVCPDSIEAIETCVEGSDQSVLSIVGRGLELCAPYFSQPYRLMPVLRGQQWGRRVTDELLEKARGLGFSSFEFMGCDYLAPAGKALGGPYVGWF